MCVCVHVYNVTIEVGMHACMHGGIAGYINMHVYAYVCKCGYVYVSVYVCVCTYECMYACM